MGSSGLMESMCLSYGQKSGRGQFLEGTNLDMKIQPETPVFDVIQL